LGSSPLSSCRWPDYSRAIDVIGFARKRSTEKSFHDGIHAPLISVNSAPGNEYAPRAEAPDPLRRLSLSHSLPAD